MFIFYLSHRCEKKITFTVRYLFYIKMNNNSKFKENLFQLSMFNTEINLLVRQVKINSCIVIYNYLIKFKGYFHYGFIYL